MFPLDFEEFLWAMNENELMEEEIYKGILKGNLSLNNGMLYENAIA